MKVGKDSCHICLDEKVYIVSNNRSRCSNDKCSAYICNICWNDLIRTDINSCPICRNDIDTEIVEHLINYSSFKLLLLHTFSIILGFITITSCYLIYGNTMSNYSIIINELSNSQMVVFMILINIVGMIIMGFAISLYLRWSSHIRN